MPRREVTLRNTTQNTVPHRFRRCTRLLCGNSTRCHLSPCWTWRRRSQSLLQCSIACRCLHLHTEGNNIHSNPEFIEKCSSGCKCFIHQIWVVFVFFRIYKLLNKWHAEYLLGLEKKWQEQAMNPPEGNSCGAKRFNFCFRSVITDKSP